jgi:hypothetical protein
MTNRRLEYHWSPPSGPPNLDAHTAANWAEWNPIEGVWEPASRPPAAADDISFPGSPAVVNRIDEPTCD